MLRVRALAMVGEHLNDPTSGDVAVAASVHHQFQLGFEGRKAANALFNLGKAGPGDQVGGLARLARAILKSEQSADGLNLKSQFPCMTNEGQAAQVGLAIMPAVAVVSERCG